MLRVGQGDMCPSYDLPSPEKCGWCVISHPEFVGALNQTNTVITTIIGGELAFQNAIKILVFIYNPKDLLEIPSRYCPGHFIQI